jgi:methyl-accepting chemotaxis protein
LHLLVTVNERVWGKSISSPFQPELYHEKSTVGFFFPQLTKGQNLKKKPLSCIKITVIIPFKKKGESQNMSLTGFFVTRYGNESLQIRKKAGILAWTALIIGGLSTLLGLVMIATGAFVAGGIIFVYSAICALVLILLKAGKYTLASSVFLYTLFLVMFAAIKFDEYKNVYECYVFGTLGSFLLIASALIGNRSRQAVVLTLLNLLAIAILYIADTLPEEMKAGGVSVLAIQSLATSVVMVTAGGFLSTVMVKMQNQLLIQVEKEAKKALENYQELNTTILGTQDKVMTVGASLALRTDNTITAIETMQKKIQEITLGMRSLSHALKRSGDSNSRAVSRHEKVQEVLESYSNQVNVASTAIEQMAAAVKNIGGQANQKRDAVRNLAGMARSGETKLTAIKEAIDQVLESSNSMMDLSRIIGDVADRTNLLGLNASIEAAHAGTVGKGFAIVADQIRKLSEEVAKSTRTIAETLEITRGAVARASSENDEAIEFFRQISSDISGVTQMMEEFLSSVQEISSGANDVLTAVETVANLTHTTEQAVAESRESINTSSDGIRAVVAIGEQVRMEAEDINSRFGTIREDALSVKKLGDENMGYIEDLKVRIEAIQKAAQH